MPLLQRARGALLGLAVGDALGAGYEFGPPRPTGEIGMIGGGPFGWEPGEWTDDTSMAIVIARAIADHGALGDVVLDQVVRGWHRWARTAKDVGNQTREILGSLGREPTAVTATRAARDYARRNPLSGGNGCLMRTTPVAFATLGDDEATYRNAVAVATLTHADPAAVRATALWTVAVGQAIVTGELPLPELDAAPMPNVTAVGAFQAARDCALNATDFRSGVEAAVRLGSDTDTVAAITGSLLGAVFEVPPEMAAAVHGWPGMRAQELCDLADAAITRAGRLKRWTEPPERLRY